ncbi:DUF1624 domain-containing protein [Candidatus Peregrinibacteria bacterium]|nr:DUF1624 domain-containing protein [Candidatus Peregrinibacteria bacterium]
MIIYHIFFDLGYLGYMPGILGNWTLTIIGRSAFVIFLVVCGVSLSLSRSRIVSQGQKLLFIKYLKRGFFIFFLGLLITLATKIYIGQGYVIFGILHLIGLSVIISYPFLKFTFINIIIGAVFLIFGFFLLTFSFHIPWFLWLGFKPEGFYTLDYFPVFPYFGFVLIGIGAGNILYKNFRRRFSLPDHAKFLLIKAIEFLGRNSLYIYLVHQPVIIGVIMILNYV